MNENTGCLGWLVRLLGGGGAAGKADALPYGLKDDFLSAAELSFFHVLRSVIGAEGVVLAKVRLGDLLFTRQPHKNLPARSRIQQKHVDFVLCDPATMRPRLVLELDDASHQREDRRERDGFVDAALQAAGLPILHVRAARTYGPREVAEQIRTAIGGTSPPPLPRS